MLRPEAHPLKIFKPKRPVFDLFTYIYPGESVLKDRVAGKNSFTDHQTETMNPSAMIFPWILQGLLLSGNFTALVSKWMGRQQEEFQIEKKISLPLKTVSNFDLIPLKINRSVSLDFVLDTGFEPILLSEQQPSDSVELNFVTSRLLKGLGTDEDLRVFSSIENSLHFSRQIMPSQDIFLVSHHDFNLSSRVGTRINGVIGWDVFSRFVVEYKRDKGKLLLHNPLTFQYKPRKRDEIIPLKIYDTKPYVECTVKLHDGTERPVFLMLDTGLTDALWLFSNHPAHMHFESEGNAVFLGRGLNGEVFGRQGLIQSIALGKYIIREPLVSVLDSFSSPTPRVFAEGYRDGSIGNEIMSRFNAIIDFRGQQLILRPGKRIRDSFSQNMTGLEVTQPIRNLPYYVVDRVEPSSPGEEAGIIAGDEIAYLNGNPASTFTLESIQALFRSGSGVRLKIQVRRNKKLITAVIILRQTAKPLKLL